MRFSLCFAALLAACSSAPRPVPARPPPAAVVAKPTLQRLIAGEAPGSTPHRWGSRSYELRIVHAGASGTGLELRLHDEMHFQGVGMRPDQMPAPQHTCTAWEALPAAILVPPTATSCAEAKDECAAIEQHLHATDRSPAADVSPMPELMFGRRTASCG